MKKDISMAASIILILSILIILDRIMATPGWMEQYPHPRCELYAHERFSSRR